MFHSLPPIARLAARILACVEEAVMRFPRYHRYTVGADLRQQAMDVVRAVHRAWRDPDRKLERVCELVESIDNLKISMQLGSQLHAFKNFREFEAISRLVNDLGRQSGGWLKGLQAKGQNAGVQDPSQRASILSSRIAHEAIR
jgi:hypothetical protein